jgi:glycosidase
MDNGYSPVKRVGVQLMEWNWKDIGRECEEYLGPAGIDYVHVSPPADHVLGNRAYVKYQPASYSLNSRSGSRQDFYDMVAKCREHNVAIMVDYVANHLASTFPTPEITKYLKTVPGKSRDHAPQCGVNVQCTSWDDQKYGNRVFGCKDYNSTETATGCAWGRSDFHHSLGNDGVAFCEFTDKISFFQKNILEDIVSCDPGFGVDIDTESLSTRQMIQQWYLLDLVNAGVTMLRVDATELVPATSLAALLEPFPWDFLTQESLGWDQNNCNFGHTCPWRFKVSTLYDWSIAGEFTDTFFDKDYFHSTFNYDQKNTTVRQNSQFTKLLQFRPYGPFNRSDLDGYQWFNRVSPQSEDVLAYIDNHDTMSIPMDYHFGSIYNAAMLFLLFHPWGAATQVMSSFNYDFWFQNQNNWSANVFDPPWNGTSLHDDWRKDISRQVASVKCRAAPTTRLAVDDPEWMKGKCLDNETDFSCQWICQHRWPGVAALTRARKMIGKDVMVDTDTLWSRDDPDFRPPHGRPRIQALAFSIGDVAWMLLRGNECEETSIPSLLGSMRKSTKLKAGNYCNIALLPGSFTLDLDKWNGTRAQKFCGDSTAMRVQVDSSGHIIEGIAPPCNSTTGIVVIHTHFFIH